MNFPSIDIQGSILSVELLSKLRSEQANFQQGKDFGPHFNNRKLKEEISFAWKEAKGQWIIFQSKLSRLQDNQAGTTETRNFWIIPLLTNFGYNLNFARSEELNGKLFPIPYRATGLDNFPVYISAFSESIDKRPPNKQLRVSPHALVQEYLNYSEHLYGIVTNGRYLRILRDASRITRLSYVEFNLEKMMEEDLYSDFVILFRLLHSSRMPVSIGAGSDSIIEKYHQEGLETGSTIRNKLGYAVKEAILSLANGFINHPLNIDLRNYIQCGNADPEIIYRILLRIIYRFLFLFVIEERNLVYAESKESDTKRYNRIYFKYYSLLSLRKLAKKLPPPDSQRNSDLWLRLLNTFALFENPVLGKKLGLMSLEGDLFGYNALCTPHYDLHKCSIDNGRLLKIIKSLTYFENEKKVLISVNYGGLDVEEFGSVYEGLLELKLVIAKIEGSEIYSCSFAGGNERSKSGSHYTPEELVQPLIKHSLEYLIEARIKEPQKFLKPREINLPVKEQKIIALLKLRVCDVACGSGHILLSAARRIALEVARVSAEEEQPNPVAIRKAMRQVIRHCIYGVDKNGMAIELCKIALWLEAHNPGEPLSFLDHHIKCGDSIVGVAKIEDLKKGIAVESFKKLPGDEPEVIARLLKKHKNEAKGIESFFDTSELSANLDEISLSFDDLDSMPESTIEEVQKKASKYDALRGAEWFRIKRGADLQTAQFFIPKTAGNEKFISTYSDFVNYFTAKDTVLTQKLSYAEGIAAEKNFFHWFLEFPEIMQAGGFDCILGNPPFLGGQRLSGNFGDDFLNYVKTEFAPAGSCDLVTYFFRRIFELLKTTGFQALISTNTIAQGGAREGGLDVILNGGGNINFAVKSMRWPGVAAVEVALVGIHKGKWSTKRRLGNLDVDFINSYLDEAVSIGNPYSLKMNENKSFQGSIVLGKGFILEPEEATELIRKNPKNKEVLFPYLNGEDLNSSPKQEPSRWVINFFDWREEFCRTNYPDCFDIVEKLVKPERLINNDSVAREKWWQFLRPRAELYKTILDVNMIFTISRVSKYLLVCPFADPVVFSDQTFVIADQRFKIFAILQSFIHNEWAWKNCSTFGSGLRYTASSIFSTLPFPQFTADTEPLLCQIGINYSALRESVCSEFNIGLTKLYNIFHNSPLIDLEIKHLQTKTILSSCYISSKIIKLRQLHKEMDEAVRDAYGWSDIDLAHDFYEVDYLPENDRIRYTISPASRKEILKRLLALNHKIHAEEVAAGLWDKKKSVKKVAVEEVKETGVQIEQGKLFE